MSYTELSNDLPVLALLELNKVQNDSLGVWVKESHEIARMIYKDLELKTNLGYEYKYKYLDVVKLRLFKGGIRLASILNKIFK